MGHQILGQAFGGKTFKLKFGHHGGNHPIRYNPTGCLFLLHYILNCVIDLNNKNKHCHFLIFIVLIFVASGRIEISAQNHNFAVDPDTLPSGVEVTHVNLNDGTCAGMFYKEKNAMTIQYHPESSPGPHDADICFEQVTSCVLNIPHTTMTQFTPPLFCSLLG